MKKNFGLPGIIWIVGEIFAGSLMGGNFESLGQSINPGGYRMESTNYKQTGTVGDVGLKVQTGTLIRQKPGFINTLFDSEPPSDITNLVVMTGGNEGEMTLYWTETGDDAITGKVTEYQIKYSTTAFTKDEWNGSFVKNLQKVIQPTGAKISQNVNVTGLNPGTTYYFGIKARDDIFLWNNVNTNNIQFNYAQFDVIPPADIDSITGLSGEIEGKIRVLWTGVGDDGYLKEVDKYILYYSSVPVSVFGSTSIWKNNSVEEYITRKSSSGYTEILEKEGLMPGVTYYVGIIAQDDSQNKSNLKITNIIKAVAQNYVPSVPKGLFVEVPVYGNTLILHWNKNTELDIIGYKIYKAESEQENFVPVPGMIYPAELTHYKDDNLVNGVTYYYKITAVDFYGGESNPGEIEFGIPQDKGWGGYINEVFDSNDLWQEWGGLWKIEKGTYTESSGFSNEYMKDNKYSVIKKVYRDYTINMKIKVLEGSGGLILRTGGIAATDNGYRLEISEKDNIASLNVLRSGNNNGPMQVINISNSSYTFTNSEIYDIKFGMCNIYNDITKPKTTDNVKKIRKEFYIKTNNNSSYIYSKIFENLTYKGYENEGYNGIFSNGKIEVYNFKIIPEAGITRIISDDDVVKLEWNINNKDGIKGYNIYRSTINNLLSSEGGLNNNSVTKIFVEDKETYEDPIGIGIQNGLTFYYRISVVGYDGFESLGSEEVSVIATSRLKLEENQVGGVVYRSKIKSGQYLPGVKVRLKELSYKIDEEGKISNEVVIGNIIKETTTDMDGKYRFGGIVKNRYLAELELEENEIKSTVGLETETGYGDVDFSLETKYELGDISGIMQVKSTEISISKIKFLVQKTKIESELKMKNKKEKFDLTAVEKAIKYEINTMFLSPKWSRNIIHGFIEIYRREELILVIPVDRNGNYEIKNLLTGKYKVRGYNGIAYSDMTEIFVKPGEKININLTFPGLSNAVAFPVPCKFSNGCISVKFQFDSSWDLSEAYIRIYTISAELVREITLQEMTRDMAGGYSYDWQMRNTENQTVSSGVYIYMIKIKNPGGREKIQKGKLMLIK